MQWAIATAAFLASAVEFVEAFTIVLVVGVTINWRSSLLGAFAAAATLAVIVATLGVALVKWVPINDFRLAVGIILILFGLKWLKKAILRYSGLKALHDEEAIFEERMAEIRARRNNCATLPAIWCSSVLQSCPARRARGCLHRDHLWQQYLKDRISKWHTLSSHRCNGRWPARDWCRRDYPGATYQGTREYTQVYCGHHAYLLWYILGCGGIRFCVAAIRCLHTHPDSNIPAGILRSC